jgi:hypothetical protein
MTTLTAEERLFNEACIAFKEIMIWKKKFNNLSAYTQQNLAKIEGECAQKIDIKKWYELCQ